MNKIVRMQHVISDTDNFLKDVSEAVEKMQESGLEVDIKYAEDTTYSALILGRKEVEEEK
jgi:hypothetical protein